MRIFSYACNFRSCDKDCGHTIWSIIAKEPMMYANLVALSLTRVIWAIEVLHCGNRDFLLLLLWPWPWPDNLQIRTWPVFPGDTPAVLIWSCYVKVFESYRLTNTGTYMHTYTDRQRDRHDTRPKLYGPLPYRFAGGQ